MTPLQISQAIALVLSLAGFVVWLLYAWSHRRYWVFSVPPISWLVHVVFFYSAVFARDYLGFCIGYSFTDWSALLRLHAVLLLLGIGALMGLDRIIVNERWTQA